MFRFHLENVHFGTKPLNFKSKIYKKGLKTSNFQSKNANKFPDTPKTLAETTA